MIHQCHTCFGIFRREPGQLFLAENLCPECEFQRSVQAQSGEVANEPLPAIPIRKTWLTRMKVLASRWAAYLDMLLLRIL